MWIALLILVLCFAPVLFFLIWSFIKKPLPTTIAVVMLAVLSGIFWYIGPISKDQTDRFKLYAAGVKLLFVCGLLTFAWLKRRGKPQPGKYLDAPPQGVEWRQTAEAFVDAKTGDKIRVWYNSKTGHRNYVRDVFDHSDGQTEAIS